MILFLWRSKQAKLIQGGKTYEEGIDWEGTWGNFLSDDHVKYFDSYLTCLGICICQNAINIHLQLMCFTAVGFTSQEENL